ncbi:MAG: hypothetical protein DPW18_10315 [Chloroflexi bacterium]|nr:hypothetical protein [Chloroflexota bacterium]MDL1943883.1 hypothetical protein [Chloroflexi bacterium CFX2]
MIPYSDPASRLSRFLYLAGAELILAGAWTLAAALTQNLRTTTLLAVTVMLLGMGCAAAPFFLKSHAVRVGSVLSGRVGQFGALAVPVLLSAFLFLRSPGVEALQAIGALFACLWLIGVEVLFFFQKPRKADLETKSPRRFAFLALASCYGVLLVPSRVPSLIDGFPWNTPFEFITATVLLPFAFFFGRDFLSKKAVTLLLTLLLAARLALTFFLPQAGLGVHIYFSEEALVSGKWERTYESFLAPTPSQVMQRPYRSFNELPVESINRHGFNKNDFWMALKFSGAISMDEDERLVILVQGASRRQIELTDMKTGEVLDVATAKSAGELDAGLSDEIPYVGKAWLEGVLVFESYGNGRFEPLILSSDGSTRSALPQIWLSSSTLDLPTGGLQSIQNLIALILLAVVLYSLFDGLYAFQRAGGLDSPDLYLALTGFVLYSIANIADKPRIHLLIIAAVGGLSIVKLLDLVLRSRTYSFKGYLFSVGLPILLMFLPLDVPNLQSVTILPQYQDALEYQMLARNIYVGGDVFLLQSPPWAYKVLFPYVIGLLHVLFGQSLAAQFFLNVWSAVLSVILMAELAAYFGLSRRNAFAAAGLFLLLTMLPVSFTYFYRFGLIEPVAILTLLLTAYFAKEGKFAAMFAAGVITGMLRLNFAGAIFTAITFLAPAFAGGFSQAWGSFIHWLRSDWKRWVSYLIAIPLPSLLIASVYSRFHPGYTLTHEMNDQTSLWSVLMSLGSVIVGGDEEFLRNQIQRNPLDLVLITLPILFGLLAALISLVYRKGIFEKLDLRLSLFLLSMLPVYVVLKPIGYFPRYSWSFLPPALILLALVLQFAFLRDNKTLQDNP